MVPSKLSVSVLPIAAWWTTTWITVPPKHQNGYDTSFWRWTTAWFTVLPKLRESGKLIQIRWTIAWITVPPKPTTDILDRVSFGKLLIELRYLRNSSSSMKRSSLVNYCLIYGTSETRIRGTFKKRGWTTAWIAVLPKPSTQHELVKAQWTTTWITVPPKPSSSFVPIKLGLN